MNKIKDFLYNFLEMIVAVALLGLIVFVLWTNLNYLMNLNQASIANASNEEQVNSDEVQTTNVTLPSDLNVEQLATVLEGYKVIENKEDFIKKFNETNPSAKILSGSFDIPNNSSIEDIIKLISK